MPELTPDEFDRFDPALFGTWQTAPAYGADFAMDDEGMAADVRAVLEVKSAEGLASPADELRRLLNEMTVEMREQFSTFRTMRESAAAALVEGDEAAQKLARADVKAATDAMSLIIRTLEKVDSLQRQLARDREIEAERVADEGGYEEAKARFVRMIEDKANERALRLFEAWKFAGPPTGVSEPGREGRQPADETSRGGVHRGKHSEDFHEEGEGSRQHRKGSQD